MCDFLAKPVDPRHLEAMLERRLCRPLEKQSSNGDSLGRACLPAIAGVDQHAALDRLLNNQELYVNLLKRLVGDYSSVADDLKNCLEKNQVQEAVQILHKLKSIAGTIGAGRLQRLSIELKTCLSGSVGWNDEFSRFNHEFDG